MRNGTTLSYGMKLSPSGSKIDQCAKIFIVSASLTPTRSDSVSAFEKPSRMTPMHRLMKMSMMTTVYSSMYGYAIIEPQPCSGSHGVASGSSGSPWPSYWSLKPHVTLRNSAFSSRFSPFQWSPPW